MKYHEKGLLCYKKKWKINSKNCEKCVNVNSFNILQTTLLQFIMIFMSCLDVSRYWQLSAFGLILQLFRSRARTGHHHKISGPSLHCRLTCSTAESDYNSLLHHNLYWTHKMQYLHIAARGTWFSEFLLTFRQLSWSNKTVGFDLFLQYFVNIDQLWSQSLNLAYRSASCRHQTILADNINNRDQQMKDFSRDMILITLSEHLPVKLYKAMPAK